MYLRTRRLLFFIFSGLLHSSAQAVNYVFPGPAGGGQTLAPNPPLHLLGSTNDSLTVSSGNYTLSFHTGQNSAIEMDGNTSIINAGEISDTFVGADATINFSSNTTFGSSCYINNSGLITYNFNTGGSAFSCNQFTANQTSFNVTNTGRIDSFFVYGSFVAPNTINNQAGGTIYNINAGGGAIELGGDTDQYTMTINNNGLISAIPPNDVALGTNSYAIVGTAGGTGSITTTINNSGSIVGGSGTGAAIQNNNAHTTIIFNAQNGGTMTGNFIGGSTDQYNVVAGSGGSASLGGNLSTVPTIQIQSGTFNQAGFSITGFNTFTVDGGAIANINGTFNGTTLNNSGTINMLSDMTASGFTNSGVLAPSGTRLFTGNFTETSNGVMAFTLTTPTTYDSLRVNGTQSIDPSSFITLSVNNNGSGVKTGDTFDIFRGNSPPTLPQFNNSALYIFIPRVVGNDIVVELTSTQSVQSAVASAGATPTVQNLANVASAILSNTSLQNQPIVTQLFLPLVNLSTVDAIVSAFNQLATQQNTMVPTATTNAMITSNSAQRQLFAFLNQEFNQKNEIAKKASAAAAAKLAAKKAAAKAAAEKAAAKGKQTQGTQGTQGTPGTTVTPTASQTQTQASYQQKPFGYIAGDAFNYKLMYGATLYGSQERQRSRQPYDYPFITKTGGLAFLTQLALTERYTAGLGLSYATTYCKTYNLGAGSTDPTRIQSYQMTFMNTYFLPDDQICIEFDVSFAQNKVHQINHIFFGAPPSVGGLGVVDFTVTGDYHSKQSNAQLVVSKNIPVVSLDVNFVPTVLFAVNHLNRAAFVDNNPNPPSQIHSGSKFSSVLLGFGASVSKDQRNEKNETIVTYEGHIMTFRELHPKPTIEIDQFVGGGPTFIALGIKPFQNTINLGGSIIMPLTANFNFTGAYDLYLKRKYTNNAITLKLNWQF